MHLDTLKYLCKVLAKSTSSGVRLYCGMKALFYYSIYHLEPDPAILHLEEILNSKSPAGVVTTPLFQFYSYVFYDDYCIIVGPTTTLVEDYKHLNTFMFLLGIAENKRKSYIEKLACAPTVSLEQMTCITAYIYTSLHGTLLAIEQVALNTCPESQYYAIAQETVIETLRVADDNAKHTQTENTPIFNLCSDYITKNIFTQISVEKMAKDLCFSRPYLCSRFKTESGIPLSLYIQKEKILEAKRFLEFTDKTLVEISSQLSFSSQSYFQNVFKKIAGETPRAYRTKKRQKYPTNSN